MSLLQYVVNMEKLYPKTMKRKERKIFEGLGGVTKYDILQAQRNSTNQRRRGVAMFCRRANTGPQHHYKKTTILSVLQISFFTS